MDWKDARTQPVKENAMRRKSFDAIISTVGVLLATLLLVASGLLFWAHSFINDNVRTQLVAQKVFFPPSAALTDPAIKPYLSQYAGQQLVNGQQAKAYADHFIAVHLREANGGLTYSELSAKARANPTDTTLPAKVDSSFRGETLRGLLLNGYAFWKMGQVAVIAGFVTLGGGIVMFLLAGLGLMHSRRTSVDVQLHVPGWHPERAATS
jgi:hypothetical protein